MSILADESIVRVLLTDGTVSNKTYRVLQSKPDRKGLILLLENDSDRQIKVNQRRVLDNVNEGESFAIQLGDKFRAKCPHCTYTHEIVEYIESINCPVHGLIKLVWKNGVNIMSATAETKPEKAEKVEKVPVKVDFSALLENGFCEIYTKKNVQFDHEKVDVRAHVMLYTGEDPRKMCFNTYDGSLGRRSKSLPFDAFFANTAVDNKRHWYAVADLDKTRAKLIKDGYEVHS